MLLRLMNTPHLERMAMRDVDNKGERGGGGNFGQACATPFSYGLFSLLEELVKEKKASGSLEIRIKKIKEAACFFGADETVCTEWG